MKLSQADFPHIRLSLITFLITLAIGGSAVLINQKFAANAQKNQHDAQQQLNDARSKLAAAQGDQENMATYTKEYSAIQRREIIGDEQRLNLIEGLEILRQRNTVLDIKYAIAPQQPYKPAITLDNGNFDLKYSAMTLQLELLHEGQLINLFSNLRRDMPGWFILDKCTLERSSGTTAAQLKADCAGGWLTLKNRNEK